MRRPQRGGLLLVDGSDNDPVAAFLRSVHCWLGANELDELMIAHCLVELRYSVWDVSVSILLQVSPGHSCKARARPRAALCAVGVWINPPDIYNRTYHTKLHRTGSTRTPQGPHHSCRSLRIPDLPVPHATTPYRPDITKTHHSTTHAAASGHLRQHNRTSRHETTFNDESVSYSTVYRLPVPVPVPVPAHWRGNYTLYLSLPRVCPRKSPSIMHQPCFRPLPIMLVLNKI